MGYLPLIRRQVKAIADIGAQYVSIGTPYDEEFLPVLQRWVTAARDEGMKVWFRGNWAGWEKWFGYESITQDEHLQKTNDFIYDHADLFEDGDIFTACPECENGGPGDPRFIPSGAPRHRAFLISLDKTAKAAFKAIKKDVTTNYYSMNGDVARLAMDQSTTRSLGGVATIDHYVKTPEQLVQDAVALAKQSGGKIVLGEMGVPIPDIHGDFTPAEQAAWLDEALDLIAQTPEIIGLNYWTNVGGSTALWQDDGTAREAVAVLERYYSPDAVWGVVLDELQHPLEGATVKTGYRGTQTDKNGYFELPVVDNQNVILEVSKDGYATQLLSLETEDALSAQRSITLVRNKKSLGFTIRETAQKLNLRISDIVIALPLFSK